MRTLAAIAIAVLACTAGAASRPHLPEAVPASATVDASPALTNAPVSRTVRPISPVPAAERIRAIVDAALMVSEAETVAALAAVYASAGLSEFVTAVAEVAGAVDADRAAALIVHAIGAVGESERQELVSYVFRHVDTSRAERMVASAVAAVPDGERAATIAAIVRARPDARIVHAIVSALKGIDPERTGASAIADVMMAVAGSIRVLPPETRTPAARESVQAKSPEWYAMRLYDGGTAMWAIATKAKWYAERGDEAKVAELYRYFVQMMIKIETSKE